MFYQIYVKYTYVIKIFIYDIWTIIFIFPMAGYRNKYCIVSHTYYSILLYLINSDAY